MIRPGWVGVKKSPIPILAQTFLAFIKLQKKACVFFSLTSATPEEVTRSVSVEQDARSEELSIVNPPTQKNKTSGDTGELQDTKEDPTPPASIAIDQSSHRESEDLKLVTFVSSIFSIETDFK